jgi:hypothetical protein
MLKKGKKTDGSNLIWVLKNCNGEKKAIENANVYCWKFNLNARIKL